MLKKYIIENYKSFRDRSSFDVSAEDEYDFLEENIKNDILKGIIFVGPNASGKTNAISALVTLMKLLFCEDYQMSRNTNYFVPKDVELLFEFEIEDEENTHTVKYEIVYKYHENTNFEKFTVDNTTIFENVGDKIHLRSFYLDKSYFTNQVLAKFFNFLENSVVLDLYSNTHGESKDSNFNPIIYYDDKIVHEVNNFFNKYKFDLKLIKRREICTIEELFVKKGKARVDIPFQMESIGTKKLIYMLPIIINLCEKTTGMLILDEYGSGLHNELEELVLKYFMSNKMGSQIFACSHSTNLLKNTLFRPDQIYSIDINDEYCSSYEKFSDQSPRAKQSLERMYLGGVFGGLPNYSGE